MPDDNALDERIRHALLSCSPHPLSEDAQGQCAALCLAGGYVGPARALYEIAFLRRGFSAAHVGWQAEVAARTRLWTAQGACDEAPVGRPIASTVALAIDELEQVARRLAGSGAAHRVSDDAAVAAAGALPRVEDQVHALYELMRRPWTEETGRTLPGLLATIDCESSVDLALLCTAPVADLAIAVVRDGLLRWRADCRDLVDEPLGAAILLHASARFETAGLGPYFSNVSQIVRRSGDILELSRRAAAAAGQSPGLEVWVTLLARKVSGSAALELVDDLGDAGALSALATIWRWIATRPKNEIPIDRLWRLRDTAIDLAGFDLAADIQAAIARLRPHHGHELTILGAIQATGGHRAEAEAAFRRCLAAHPDDHDAKVRLRALRAGTFEAFEIREGFGTSPLHRYARRQFAPGPRQPPAKSAGPDAPPASGKGEVPEVEIRGL